jgi:hypothetical protein
MTPRITPGRFTPNPRVRRWLRGDDPTEVASTAGDGWDVWLLHAMSRGRVHDVGGVLVDAALLEQRFACVPDRCAPGPGRGRFRSCCADVAVEVTRAEARRLGTARGRVARHLAAREPRLGGLPLSLVEDGALTRPGGRCVMSCLGPDGRIRCHLHAFGRAVGRERRALQPAPCQLFPLIVVDVGDGRVALTVVSRATWRLAGARPPAQYPCLADPTLPALKDSLAADLDWLMGPGFARALRERVRAASSRRR